jgi:hypothetical protein
MLTILALFVLAQSPAAPARAVTEPPVVVRVLVLNFDPKVPAEGGRRLHDVLGWQIPRELADAFIRDVREISGGFIRYRIVKWRDLDEFPAKIDGFRYTVDGYLKAWRAREGFHVPDTADYEKLIADHGVDKMIDAGRIDELWLFGSPYMGFWESAMAGPRSFFINGGVYDEVRTKRPFAIMGFSYERGNAEMLHNLCHRAEATMSRVYGGWRVEQLDTTWARFASNVHQSGSAGVGTCHYPPNAESGYDYANPRTVMSDADDWLDYPNLTGTKRPVNKDSWGGPDYHRNYLRWWFTRLPRAPGIAPDGKEANWWKYIYQFDKYDAAGQPRKER